MIKNCDFYFSKLIEFWLRLLNWLFLVVTLMVGQLLLAVLTEVCEIVIIHRKTISSWNVNGNLTDIDILLKAVS